MSKLPKKLSEVKTPKVPKKKKKSIEPSKSLNQSSYEPPIAQFPKKQTSTHKSDKTQNRIITKITTQKQKGRYNVFVDDRFAFGVDEGVLVKFQLAKGMQVTEAMQTAIENNDSVRKAYQRALSYLSHQLRTEKQIRDDLIEKEFESEADAVIEKLKEMHLLNDLEYAKSYVRTASRINRKGPHQIIRDLTQKGVSETLAQGALGEYPYADQYENAITLGEKQIKKSKKRSSIQTENKVRQFLMQKGFDNDIIQDVLQELETEKDTDEEMEALIKEGDKAWRRYRRFDPYEQKQKTKASLYQKGYPGELIGKFITKKEMEEE